MEWISLYVDGRRASREREARSVWLYMYVDEYVSLSLIFKVKLIRILAWAGDRRWRGMEEVVEGVVMMQTLAFTFVKSVSELYKIFSCKSTAGKNQAYLISEQGRAW